MGIEALLKHGSHAERGWGQKRDAGGAHRGDGLGQEKRFLVSEWRDIKQNPPTVNVERNRLSSSAQCWQEVSKANWAIGGSVGKAKAIIVAQYPLYLVATTTRNC